MKLLALLIGLIVERLATQLFHWRRLRWLDRLFDFGFRQCERFANWPPVIPVVLLAIVMVLPVFVVVLSLGDTLFGFPYLILAIIVLFFSLGPKDIGEDVDEYCRAIEADDEQRINAMTKALIEKDAPADPLERISAVEAAVCVQANNRLFAVIFWFVLLGPLGAWTYRVTDLVRRRAVFNASRDDGNTVSQDTVEGTQLLHGWLAWIPARLTAIGYAMAGSFEGALSAWRNPQENSPAHLNEQNESLLARVGIGALGLHPVEGESNSDRGVRGATAANGLVFRLLFIWAAVIAAMTLYGWSV
ncbi:MAG: AmpE protein [Woeseiaceae bacterium]|jgi:AmpE protein